MAQPGMDEMDGELLVRTYDVGFGDCIFVRIPDGGLMYPDASKTLANLGTTWLGIAVAAGYAYFGIKPQ